jgi:hypothetical protein
MSQFFGTNPASRPAAGPKLEAWERDLPADWRAGLGLTAPSAPVAAEAPEGEAPLSSDQG